MDAGTCHDLLSANWRPQRRAGAVNRVWIWRPENRGSCGVNPSLRAGEDELSCPSSGDRQEAKAADCSSFHFFSFASGPQSLEERYPQCGGRSALQRPPLKCWLHLETPSQTHPAAVFNLGTPRPNWLSAWLNHPSSVLLGGSFILPLFTLEWLDFTISFFFFLS